METCRNCGQKTLATLDWACPWCGSPIKRGKRLEVTYSQAVKLRRLPEEQYVEIINNNLPAEAALERPVEELGYILPVVPEDDAETVIVTDDEEEFKDMTTEIDMVRAYQESEEDKPIGTCPGDDKLEVSTVESGTTWEAAMENVPGVFGVEETVESVKEHAYFGEKPIEEVPEALYTADKEAQKEKSSFYVPGPAREKVEDYDEPEPVSVIAIDITLEELMEAYQQDDAEADTRYNNQVLAITGFIALVNIREDRDFQYVTLAGQDQNIFRSIKCVFNLDKAFQLKDMQRGQGVVILGRFKGSLTSMSLVDCSII